MSWDISIGKVTDYGFDYGKGWDFSLCHHVQTTSMAHPVPCMKGKGKGGSSPGAKSPECKANHSPPPSAKVNNAWNLASIPNTYSFVVFKCRDKFYLFHCEINAKVYWCQAMSLS
jgi:hypothetical protein